MPLTGNKGEWAEIYTFFKLLAEGKIYAADENMIKLEDIYFPILKIIREEVIGQVYDYKTGDKIRIYLNNEYMSEVDIIDFVRQSDYLFKQIHNSNVSSFQIEETEAFMHTIYVRRIKEPGTHKADILMQIQEIYTGMVLKSGFSIKSDFKSKAHLINASEATNFIYEIVGFDDKKMNTVNLIDSDDKIIKKMNYIKYNSNQIKFVSPFRITTKKNLTMVDSLLAPLIANALLYHYFEGVNLCSEIVNLLEERDPLNYDNHGVYTYKIKKLFSACALGLKIGQEWDGIEEANGGYIVVKNNGEILAYHIYNRNVFENFIFCNTKFERGSTSKHKYCIVYKENEKYYIKLNWAVRFK